MHGLVREAAPCISEAAVNLKFTRRVRTSNTPHRDGCCDSENACHVELTTTRPLMKMERKRMGMNKLAQVQLIRRLLASPSADGHKRKRETFPGETDPLPDRPQDTIADTTPYVVLAGEGGNDGRLGCARRQPTNKLLAGA